MGIYSSLERAKEAANGLDVRLGGGVATIKQYLRGLVEQLAITPILLGSGARVFSDVDMPSLGYQCIEHAASQNATHIVIAKR